MLRRSQATSVLQSRPHPPTGGEDEFKKKIEESGISEDVLMKTTIKDLNKMLKVRI